MAAIPLSPYSAPHLSRGLASAQSAEGSAYRFRAEFCHTPSMPHCYRRILFSEVARDTSAGPRSHMARRYLQSTLISPIGGATEERRRKVLSFKHPPSMPSRLYILGFVRPSTPQEYRSTMRLGCKSVSGCPAPLPIPFLFLVGTKRRYSPFL
jgi:hypothetical protein